MKYLLISLILFCGCTAQPDTVRYPSISVDSNIGYRLWYGDKPHMWFDVAQANCAFINGVLECSFEDFSDIIGFEMGQSVVQGRFIKIKKRNSTWYLCNYDNEDRMFLMVGDHTQNIPNSQGER